MRLLCRPMSGEPLAHRPPQINAEAMPHCGGEASSVLLGSFGKAYPFRLSGGSAAASKYKSQSAETDRST